MQNRCNSSFHPLLGHTPLESYFTLSSQPLGPLLGVPEVQSIGEVLAGSEESEGRQNHRHEFFMLNRASGGYHSNKSSHIRFLQTAVGVVFDVRGVEVIVVWFWEVGWEWSRMTDDCERVPERCLIVFLMMEVDGFPQVVGVVFAFAWAFRGD